MKLKNGIITDSSSGEFIAVATGEASRVFNGMIKNIPSVVKAAMIM